MKSCIHFIRHGITQGILNRWYYGWEDMPLVEEGIKEIDGYIREGIYPSCDGADMYSSGMIRANQTLEQIYGKVPYREMELLKEMNFGEWECKTFDELKDMEGFDQWMSTTDGSFRFPGGESAKDFYQRTEKGLKELIGYHRLKELSHRHSGKDCTSIVVCHGGVIASAMCQLMGIPVEDFWKWIPQPARGFTFYFDKGEPVKYEAL